MNNQDFQGRPGAFAPRQPVQQQTQVFQPQPNPYPPAQGGYQQMPPQMQQPPMMQQMPPQMQQQPMMQQMPPRMPDGQMVPPSMMNFNVNPNAQPMSPEQLQMLQEQRRAQYEKLYTDYYNTNHNIRSVMSDGEADAEVERMNDSMEMINAIGSTNEVISFGSIDKVCMLIEQVANQISNPKLFLPEERVAHYEPSLKVAGGKIATAMRQYAEKIKTLKVV